MKPAAKPSILISACLLGQPVRYDGTGKLYSHPMLQRWLDEGRIVPVCPEMSGGLPVPRAPAEITLGAGGLKVLAGEAKVVGAHAQDFSAEFMTGALGALALAQAHNIRVAVLKEGSPSCGSGYTYDGSFTATKVTHPGVTTALLRQSGIQVFSEHQLEQADILLKLLEAEAVATSHL